MDVHCSKSSGVLLLRSALNWKVTYIFMKESRMDRRWQITVEFSQPNQNHGQLNLRVMWPPHHAIVQTNCPQGCSGCQHHHTWAEPHNANGVIPKKISTRNDEPAGNSQQRSAAHWATEVEFIPLFASAFNWKVTQLGFLTNSKSRLFCVGDQAEFVGIRGRRE